MARARLAKPAAIFVRRNQPSNSLRCSWLKETFIRASRLSMATSLWAKEQVESCAESQIVTCSPIYGEMY
jgi:hypothetical protein